MSSFSSIGSSSSLNTSGIQFSGLASGIDTNKLIEGLVAVEKARVTQLQTSQAKVAQQQAVFQSAESKLLAVQSQANRLGRTFNTVFDSKAATSNNKDLVTGAASASAQPGVYNFRVQTLARAQAVGSQGFADPTSTLAAGELQIKVGSSDATSITINSSNNTLQGLASAINNAGADVTASIVNEGTGAAPYRLLLTSKQTGAANTIALSGAAAAQLGAVTVQAAGDASIKIGSGAGEITVSSATNQIDSAFSGVTLNLLTADPTKEVALTVANDTEAAKSAVKDFVGAYNDLSSFISSQTKYDAKSNQAGVLLGNSQINDIENTLTNRLTSVVSGVNGRANRLSAIGISLDEKGKLNIDDAKLSKALSGQLSGVSVNDVRRLFALDGVSSNTGVQFIAAGSSTKVSTSPVQVNITQAATKGSVQGAALSAPITLTSGTGGNNELTLTVDGRTSGTISLAANTYTLNQLADELQGKINADSALSGKKITVSVDNNQLKLVSETFGASSRIAIGSGSAIASGVLGFSGTESGSGQDVAGNFVVNGVVEPAIGIGQNLSAVSTNATTKGLQVRVTLTSAQVQGGTSANLSLTRGLASQLDVDLNKYLDPVNGRLKTIDKTFNDSIEVIQGSIDRQNARITAKQEALVLQFAAMEGTVSKLKSTGDYLTAQFAKLSSS